MVASQKSRNWSPTGGRRRKVLLNSLETGVLVIFLLIYLFPVIWQVLTSFKIQSDAYAIPPKWFFEPTLRNYRVVLLDRQMGRFLL